MRATKKLCVLCLLCALCGETKKEAGSAHREVLSASSSIFQFFNSSILHLDRPRTSSERPQAHAARRSQRRQGGGDDAGQKLEDDPPRFLVPHVSLKVLGGG